MTLRRERAEAALNPGTPNRTDSMIGAVLSWIIPPSTVHISPSAAAGLAALPAVSITYLLWTIHTGRSTMRALCQCWIVAALVSLALRWHIVTIVVEHAGASVSITIWQWFTAPDAVSSQLARAFKLHNGEVTMEQMISDHSGQQPQDSQQWRLYDSSHSAALPLSYLVAAEFLPQLQSASGSPNRRFQLSQVAVANTEASCGDTLASDEVCSPGTEEGGKEPPAGKLVSFKDATLMDAREVHRAAAVIAASAVSANDSEARVHSSVLSALANTRPIAKAFAEQLATQGFVRLKVTSPASSNVQGHQGRGGLPAAAAAQTAAASVFRRTRVEKLAMSSRLWEPEPTGRCVCMGYCAQDCARE